VLIPIRFKLGDTTVYSRAFEMLGRQAADLSVPLREIGEMLIVDIGHQFQSEGAWGGSSWAELSDKYSIWKEQHYPGMPLLVASGDMRAAMLDPAQTLTVSPNLLVYEVDGELGEIALAHQEGVEANNLPARPMIEVPELELHEWDRVLVRWLQATSEPLWGPFHK
jgi:hypothetical protein